MSNAQAKGSCTSQFTNVFAPAPLNPRRAPHAHAPRAAFSKSTERGESKNDESETCKVRLAR